MIDPIGAVKLAVQLSIAIYTYMSNALTEENRLTTTTIFIYPGEISSSQCKENVIGKGDEKKISHFFMV